jgi:hypothetical protein
MKVIGVGLPRTATLTQKVALEMLGFGPCYHMVNVIAELPLAQLWLDALDGKADWARIFEGFESTVDWPGGFFYRELYEQYPDAKFVLSVRDPEAWERSMRDTVWGVVHGDSLIRHMSSATAIVNPNWDRFLTMAKGLLWENRGTLRERHETSEGLIEGMRRHSEDVMRVVPADQLLVWEATEGWEPLCEFLDVDVPSEPLPHVNDSAEFKARIIEMGLNTLNPWWEQQKAEAEPVSAAH